MDHEARACEAVIEIIRRRSRQRYRIESRPDKENRGSQDIDFILSSKDVATKFAVEHTTLESFENQRTDSHMIDSFVERLKKECEGHVRPYTFYLLHIPTDMVRRTKGKQQERIIDELLTWIPTVMDDMDPYKNRWASIETFGHRIWLSMRNSYHFSRILVPAQIVPYDEDSQRRVARVDRALADKLPKLHDYKTAGYDTILILEAPWADILSNSTLVAESTMRASVGHEHHLPDYIYQVSSFVDRIDEGWVLKDHAQWRKDVPENGPYRNLAQPDPES